MAVTWYTQHNFRVEYFTSSLGPWMQNACWQNPYITCTAHDRFTVKWATWAAPSQAFISHTGHEYHWLVEALRCYQQEKGFCRHTCPFIQAPTVKSLQGKWALHPSHHEGGHLLPTREQKVVYYLTPGVASPCEAHWRAENHSILFIINRRLLWFIYHKQKTRGIAISQHRSCALYLWNQHTRLSSHSTSFTSR